MSSTDSRTVSVAVAALAILTSLAGPIRSARAGTPVFEIVYDRIATHSARLITGTDGSVYGSGVTAAEGTIVFRIDGAGTFTIVHSFDPYVVGTPANLAVGDDGAVYGAAGSLFFRIANQVTTILSSPFDELLISELVLGSDGAFYGTTGGLDCENPRTTKGLFFKIDRDGVMTPLASDPCYGSSIPIVLGIDGAIYGLGRNVYDPLDLGHYFRLDTAGNYTIAHSFSSDEGASSSLVVASDGRMYGADHGKVFSLDIAGNYVVHGDGPIIPHPRLTIGADSALYGVTDGGGTENLGTIFRVDLSGAVTTVHSFHFPDSGQPNQPLTLARDGALWGATWLPTAFRFSSTGTLTSFPLPAGMTAVSPLAEGSDCAHYGIGDPGSGTTGVVYRVFEAGQLCQRITFDPLPDRTLRDPPFMVSATASSGLPVSFTASGRCTLRGDQVRLKRGVGVCRLTAFQNGDSRFLAAEDVTQEFRVGPPRGMRR